MLFDVGAVQDNGPSDAIGQLHERVSNYYFGGAPSRPIGYDDCMRYCKTGRPDPPFTDIGRGLTGQKKKDVWAAAYYLYRTYFYEIVCASINQMDLESVKNRIDGETVASLELLKNSFDQITKISRDQDYISGDQYLLMFKFLSRHKTYHGESIEMISPILVQYRPVIKWAVYKPELIIGGGKK